LKKKQQNNLLRIKYKKAAAAAFFIAHAHPKRLRLLLRRKIGRTAFINITSILKDHPL